jgi:hypothetical protein
VGDETDLPFEDTIHLAQLDDILDDTGKPYYRPGGHHEVPRSVFGRWNLSDETRRIFERATSGSIPPTTLRMTPDGVPQGHFWNGPNGPHGRYNAAVEELGVRFLERNRISPEQVTPDHARALLKEIRETTDPRIREYNNVLRLLRRLFPLRTGRGAD